MELVIQDYEDSLRKKGNQANSIKQTMRAVRLWADPVQSVANVTNRQLARFYARRSAKTKADTHRWELAIVQTFWRWIVESGLVTRSPAEGIKPFGRRKKGKPQLRRSEARAFSEKAEELALGGGHVIARELGHTSHAITKRHYTKAGADDRARTRRMLKVVEGGKIGNETS